MEDPSTNSEVKPLKALSITSRDMKKNKKSFITKSIMIGLLFVVSIGIIFFSSSPSNILQPDELSDSLSSMSGSGVLVTGATGRTGSLLYFELIERGVPDVRAFVRDSDRAREILGCTKCDESEGIYVGDVTDIEDLKVATKGVSTVAIAVGSGVHSTEEEQKAVEFIGVQNTVAALAQTDNLNAIGGSSEKLRVVLCSSMGTTRPGQFFWTWVLFWKLNAEAFLMSSGVGFTIVKPCGLSPKKKAGMAVLVTGHHDTFIDIDPPTISRKDVASVMAEAVVEGAEANGRRFDLCSEEDGPKPLDTNFKDLLENAKWDWER